MGRSTKNVRTQFWDARQFWWKWVDTVQMLHMWNVTIACGMLLLLVECYDSLWNATIACGMLLLLVECYDGL